METVHDTDVVFETLDGIGLRATVGKCMMDSDQRCAEAAARRHAGVDRREHGARQALGRQGERTIARGVRAAVRRLVLAQPARGGRRTLDTTMTRSSTRMRRSRVTKSTVVRQAVGRPVESRVPCRRPAWRATAVRGPLRVGDGRGTGAAGRARRESDALPRLQPEAGIRHRSGRRNARAAGSRFRSARTARRATTASTCSTRCGWRRRFRAFSSDRARSRHATRSGWRRGKAHGRSASSLKSVRLKWANGPT